MQLRFTIRDLLWLTAVVALAVGWWLDHRRLVELAKSPLLKMQEAHPEIQLRLSPTHP